MAQVIPTADQSHLVTDRNESVIVEAPDLTNAFEAIRSNPIARKFEIGDMLFAQFNCPAEDKPVGIWTQMDQFVHMLSGTKTWKTATETWSAEAGQTVFFKKGVYLIPEHSGD